MFITKSVCQVSTQIPHIRLLPISVIIMNIAGLGC